MARSTADIENILRLLLAGKSHAQITTEVYGKDTDADRPSLGVWFRFKTKYLKNPDLNTSEKILAALLADGYTLSSSEANQLTALAHTAVTASKGPKTARNTMTKSQRAWGGGTSLGTAPGQAPAAPSTARTDTQVVDFSPRNPWLARKGIPYATAKYNACTQPVGTIEGNVCGEPISAGRLHQGKTTCIQCHEATRDPQTTSKTDHSTSYTLYTGR